MPIIMYNINYAFVILLYFLSLPAIRIYNYIDHPPMHTRAVVSRTDAMKGAKC